MQKIGDVAPKNLKEADEFKNNNKLDAVKDDLHGQVKDEQKASQGSPVFYDPRGRRYFWIGGEPRWEEGPDCDHAAVTAGLVSVTPLRLDLTDYPTLERRPAALAALARALEWTG